MCTSQKHCHPMLPIASSTALKPWTHSSCASLMRNRYSRVLVVENNGTAPLLCDDYRLYNCSTLSLVGYRSEVLVKLSCYSCNGERGGGGGCGGVGGGEGAGGSESRGCGDGSCEGECAHDGGGAGGSGRASGSGGAGASGCS